jgi:hypothetical protein
MTPLRWWRASVHSAGGSPAISAFRRLRQEDGKFEAKLSYRSETLSQPK